LHLRIAAFSEKPKFAIYSQNDWKVPIVVNPVALQGDRKPMNECPELGSATRAPSIRDWVLPATMLRGESC
jgi:hypothetical protein